MPPRGVLPKTMPNPPTYSKVNPADTPILTLQLTSDTLPLEKVNDLADTVLAQKLSEVTGVGLVTIEGNQKPAVRVRVNPAGHRVARPEPGRRAHRADAKQRQRAQRQLRRRAPVLRHQRQRPDFFRRRLSQRHHRLPERFARCGCATSAT